MHEIADSLTKDICAVSSIYMPRLIDFKKSVVVAQSSQSTPEFSETMSLDSQSLKLVDDLVANFKSTKAIARDIGNYVNEKKCKNCDNVNKGEVGNDVNVRKIEGGLSDDDIAFFSLLSSLNDDLWKDCKEDGDDKNGLAKKNDDVSNSDDDAPTFHLLSLSDDKIKDIEFCKDVKDVKDGQAKNDEGNEAEHDFNCDMFWSINLDAGFLSKFMINNI